VIPPGDRFRAAAKAYLKLMFTRGVPSTFANLKHLYSDPFKKETLPALAEEYLQELSESSNAESQESTDSSKGKGAACTSLPSTTTITCPAILRKPPNSSRRP
jgi:hypothetical protein